MTNDGKRTARWIWVKWRLGASTAAGGAKFSLYLHRHLPLDRYNREGYAWKTSHSAAEDASLTGGRGYSRDSLISWFS